MFLCRSKEKKYFLSDDPLSETNCQNPKELDLSVEAESFLEALTVINQAADSQKMAKALDEIITKCIEKAEEHF
jgi:hypothetical protein